ncbi:uncharacterized protein LOC122145514 [Tachysurus ichikawai]
MKTSKLFPSCPLMPGSQPCWLVKLIMRHMMEWQRVQDLLHPFEFPAVDLFRPYQIKDDVKRRATMKVWVVVSCCMANTAIHVELANALSTESFLFLIPKV